MRPGVRDGLTGLGIAAGYFACILLGAALSVPDDAFPIIWPVRAFLISVLLLLPTRRWWWIAAAIPTHLAIGAVFMPGSPLGLMIVQVASHLAVALLTAYAVRRLNPPEAPFDGVVPLSRFILVGGLLVPGMVDGVLLAVKNAAGWEYGLEHIWRDWMVAGFFPTITIPPLLVLAAQRQLLSPRGEARGAQRELALIVPAVFVVSILAFGGVVNAEAWPAVYLAPLPFLLWAAARLGVGGTSLVLLAMATAIAIQALRDVGPFAAAALAEEVDSLQAFLAAASAPLLLFAALMDERRRTANLLRQFEARMQGAASQTDTGLWLWDALQPRLWTTDNCRAMFGLPEEQTSTPYAFLDAVHPDDRALVAAALEGAINQGTQMPVVEFRLCTEGKTRWFVLQARTTCDETGRLASISGVFRDISDRVESRLAVERLEDRLASLQDDERRRIAHELHESTAQHLVAAKLNLLAARKQLDGQVRDLVEEAFSSVSEAAAEVRTFTYLLHASQLDEEGICSMLRRYVPGFARRTGIPTALRVTERADELPGEVQHALLRITQESLGNLHRHAGATRATVDLRCVGECVHLVVCDNGKGMGEQEGAQLGERLRLGLGIRDMTVRVRTAPSGTAGKSRRAGTAIHAATSLRDIARPGARGIASIAREALGAGRG